MYLFFQTKESSQNENSVEVTHQLQTMIQVTQFPATFGVIAFRPHFNPQDILKITEEKPLSTLITQEDWDLTVRRFEELISKGSLECIESLKVQSLKIRWGASQKIIPSIKMIQFPCLKQLHLNGNLIENIEGLVSLNLSSLVVLNFKQNYITSITALRKCHLPTLKELNLYKNKIIDFRPLQELHAPQLTVLWIAPQRDCFIAQQSSSWIFKLQPKHLSKIFIRHPSGRNFDFQEVKSMATTLYSNVELIYRIRDDFE